MASKANPILSSHKDAARRVSDYLSNTHNLALKQSTILEVVARVLGAENWQTLSALAKEGRVPRAGDDVIWCDSSKLPPVGQGNVLKDLLSRGLITMRAGALHSADGVASLLSADDAQGDGLRALPERRTLTVRPRHVDHPRPIARPSTDWHTPGFIWEFGRSGFYSTESTGKWCVFREAKDIDALWEKVAVAVRQGKFAAALVSSARQARDHGDSNRFVICAFTRDWTNSEDVMRALQVLRNMGVAEELGYKRDLETFNNVYGGPKEWYYRA